MEERLRPPPLVSMGILLQFLLEMCLPTLCSPTSQQGRATDLCLVKKNFYHWVEGLGNTEILLYSSPLSEAPYPKGGVKVSRGLELS